MTENKPIYVDGVDVSWCRFCERHCTEDKDVEIKDFCKIFHYHCETEPNCYFKLLARKMQECEELKKQIESYRGLITNAGKQNYQLVQEYDRLKVENERYKEEIMLLRKGYDEEDCTKTCPNMQIYERELKQAEQTIDNLIKIQYKLANNSNKYSQKLEEIEKIAKDFHYAIIPFHRGKNHEMADRIDYYLDKILQIIDEVGNE